MSWSISVAMWARLFFSPDRELRTSYAIEINKQLSDSVIEPFTVIDFLQFLPHRGTTDVWPRIHQIERILRAMEREGVLLAMGGGGGGFVDQRYMLYRTTTRLQLPGVLWLAPILGDALVVEAFQPIVVHISGTNPRTGDEHGGTGLLLAPDRILTAAHVVLDMDLASEIRLPTDGSARKVTDVHLVESSDVAVIEITATDVDRDRPDVTGLAFRDPEWADRVHILGFPPVPMASDAYLTMQSGEIVNPGVRDYLGADWFLFSAIARPGNSGGPVIGSDGRVVGIVTREFGAENATLGSSAPSFAGVPTRVIARSLKELGYGEDLLPVEDWTA